MIIGLTALKDALELIAAETQWGLTPKALASWKTEYGSRLKVLTQHVRKVQQACATSADPLRTPIAAGCHTREIPPERLLTQIVIDEGGRAPRGREGAHLARSVAPQVGG